MEVYKVPILVAIITFPFIAFIITLPFLIYEYRKFGAVPALKSLIVYSMVLYLLCAYFLVILPLPTIEEVSNYTGSTMQLIPFNFISDIKLTTVLDPTSLKSILDFINKPTVFTVLFNILLTLPFGVYLKYLFNLKWYQTVFYSFLLSLFFEMTQLSGLYGIYPRPYRLFDVDDLIINTFGGLLGHLITPLFLLFVPDKNELDNKSYLKGQKVSIIRRIVSLIIDLVFLLIVAILFKVAFINTRMDKFSLLIAILFYYIIIPLLNESKTIGQTVVKIKISSFNEKYKSIKLIIRNLILSFLILYPAAWLTIIYKDISTRAFAITILTIVFINIMNLLVYLFKIKGQHLFLYEWISNTKCESNISLSGNLVMPAPTVKND